MAFWTAPCPPLPLLQAHLLQALLLPAHLLPARLLVLEAALLPRMTAVPDRAVTLLRVRLTGRREVFTVIDVDWDDNPYTDIDVLWLSETPHGYSSENSTPYGNSTFFIEERSTNNRVEHDEMDSSKETYRRRN